MSKVTNFLNSRLKLILAHPITRRALHSAWQAGLVVWVLTGYKIDKASLGAVAAAVLSALKTSVVEYVESRRS